ncbi:HD domain-containing protein [Wolinella succinogenes]|uniref:[protein-PII] uridylyltransferase family protein n=1 Tax=Wolinella succinogenes TaxID=844 RepID=UPI0002F39460|nr:HD domain-containing protein [Wolinella succinogenes]HCZ18026.1 HD domain-containing protein [Helicobacter sp.]
MYSVGYFGYLKEGQMQELFEESLTDLEDELAVSKAIKGEVRHYMEGLEEKFDQNLGRHFSYRHAREMDRLVAFVYKAVIRRYFKEYLPPLNHVPLVFIALGSYGREQLSVHSDIDLMIVYKEVGGYNLLEMIEKMIHIGWDCGLKISHRVHEVGELLEVSRSDITIKTSFLEARFICGSKILYMETEARIEQIRKDNKEGFLREKYLEYLERHKKFEASMEPNIKEGRGGIRDANMLFWVLYVLYNVKNPKEMEGQLYDEERYRDFRSSLEFLFRLRDAMHLVNQKKNDTLNLELLPFVAKKLGMESQDSSKDQFGLAKKTLLCMHEIEHFCAYVLRQIYRRHGLLPAYSWRERKEARQEGGLFLFKSSSSERLYARGALKRFRIGEFLGKLLELETIPEMSEGVVERLHRSKLTLSSKKERERFKELLLKPQSHRFFRALYEAGKLGEVLPPLAKIRHLPQFDGYHAYPVDLHTLKALEILEALERDSHPFLSELYGSLDQESLLLLKLLVLFHDAGKGRSRDHHLVGETLFRSWSKRFLLSEESRERGGLLVRFHTLMSSVAQKQDIYSEEVLLEFVSRLKEPENLDLLLLLTYADVSAVSPGRFNKFIEKLLLELYKNAKATFEKRELLGDATRKLKRLDLLERSAEFLALPSPLRQKIRQIASPLFFIKLTPAQIAELSKKALGVEDFCFEVENQDFLSVSILRRQELNLGYLLGKLSIFNVASMEIFKMFDGIKYFHIEFLEKAEEDEMERLREIISESFDMTRHPKAPKPTILKKDIIFEPNHSESYAEIRLNTKNQKGILAHVASVFDAFGIDIASAKIMTIKERTRDWFLIEKNEAFFRHQGELVKAIAINDKK